MSSPNGRLPRPLYNIGEQVYKLSPELKSCYPDIPWNLISGLRHRLVHDYEGINWSVIVEVVFDDICNAPVGYPHAALVFERERHFCLINARRFCTTKIRQKRRIKCISTVSVVWENGGKSTVSAAWRNLLFASHAGGHWFESSSLHQKSPENILFSGDFLIISRKLRPRYEDTFYQMSSNTALF